MTCIDQSEAMRTSSTYAASVRCLDLITTKDQIFYSMLDHLDQVEVVIVYVVKINVFLHI